MCMAWDRRQESSTLGCEVAASKDPSHKNRSLTRRTSVWTSARKLIDAWTSLPTERCSRHPTLASQIETHNLAQIETFSIRPRWCHGSRQQIHRSDQKCDGDIPPRAARCSADNDNVI